MQPFSNDIAINNLAYYINVKLELYPGVFRSNKDKYAANCDAKFNFIKSKMYNLLGWPSDPDPASSYYSSSKTRRQKSSSYNNNARTRKR